MSCGAIKPERHSAMHHLIRAVSERRDIIDSPPLTRKTIKQWRRARSGSHLGTLLSVREMMAGV